MKSERNQLGDLPSELGTDHGQLTDVPSVDPAQYSEAPKAAATSSSPRRAMVPAWVNSVLSFLVPHLFGPVSFVSRPFTIGTSSVKLTGGKKGRRYLLIQNNSGGKMYINFDSEAAITNSIIVPAGGNYEPFRVPDNAIYIRAEFGSSNGVLVEG